MVILGCGFLWIMVLGSLYGTNDYGGAVGGLCGFVGSLASEVLSNGIENANEKIWL